MPHHYSITVQIDLTYGNITSKLWRFALPLMAGNILQQFYNLADTWIVSRYIGAQALAAVGSSYTLMTFILSIIIGLCIGSSAFFSIQYGKKDFDTLRKSIFISFVLTATVSVFINIMTVANTERIIRILNVPEELEKITAEYLKCVFMGITAVFIYNFFACLLRSIGNSTAPLIFLTVSVILNIILDVFFITVLKRGIKGAAEATVISQFLAGIGLGLFSYISLPDMRIKKQDARWSTQILKEIGILSAATGIQQSVMNFGILMIQGLVNTFGTITMAAFSAAVKIDTLAYMPVQDFGNAFSTFVAQNHGAKKTERIKKGIKASSICVFIFCITVGTIVFFSAGNLMSFFTGPENLSIIKEGVQYLRIEASFYFGIGILFMLYGYFRAVGRPEISLLLTVISLGTRVVLAYLLSPVEWIGQTGIWAAIPFGWILADITGIILYRSLPENKLKNIKSLQMGNFK